MKRKFLTPIFLATVLATFLIAPPSSSAQSGTRRVEIVAKRFDFTPGDITLRKASPWCLC